MSIRALKTLITVAERGTFSAAAETLLVTHAAVSQQMKALEEEWKITIFDRSKRKPSLTPVGKVLVVKARDVVKAYETLVPSVLGENWYEGELLLGVVPTAFRGLVPATLALVKELYPELKVRVVPGLTHELSTQVERGFLDVALVTKPPMIEENQIWWEIVKEPFELIAADQTESDDPIELLRNNPYIRFSRSAVVGAMIDNWLRDKGLEVFQSMEIDSLDAIYNMVYCNMGVAIVPKSCVEVGSLMPLKRLSLDETMPPRTLGVIARADTVKIGVVDMLTEQFKNATKAG